MTTQTALDRLFHRLTYVPETMQERGAFRTQAAMDSDNQLFTDALDEVKALKSAVSIYHDALINIETLGNELDFDASECAHDALVEVRDGSK